MLAKHALKPREHLKDRKATTKRHNNATSDGSRDFRSLVFGPGIAPRTNHQLLGGSWVGKSKVIGRIITVISLIFKY